MIILYVKFVRITLFYGSVWTFGVTYTLDQVWGEYKCWLYTKLSKPIMWWMHDSQWLQHEHLMQFDVYSYIKWYLTFKATIYSHYYIWTPGLLQLTKHWIVKIMMVRNVLHMQLGVRMQTQSALAKENFLCALQSFYTQLSCIISHLLFQSEMVV